MAKKKSDPRQVHVPRSKAGMRLDRFLADLLPKYSRRKIQEVLRQGEVRVDGVRARSGTMLAGGEKVTLPELGPAVAAVHRERRARERLRRDAAVPDAVVELYRDADLLVVDKPPGMPVHGGANLGAVTTLLEALEADIVAGYGLVHRLDRDTSGVIALVRGEEARKRTAARFADAEGGIEKTYEALVDGTPDPSAGEIDRPLTTPDRSGRVRVDADEGRPARTRYTVLESFPLASRLRLELLTGRTHQIRAHVADRGHPLLVDPRYGRRSGWRLVDPRGKLDARLRRTPLHATRLVLPHPKTEAPLEVTAPLPGDLRYALEVLRVDAARRRG